jgi:hypothetical protein
MFHPGECNYRAEMTVLTVGHFWTMPTPPSAKCPTGFCVGASRSAAQYNKLTNSQAGRKFFSRGPMDTAFVTVTFPL